MTGFFIQNRPLITKNIFPQKLLFFLKTYSNSSPNTKYEGLTRKTERDSSKNRSEIPCFSLIFTDQQGKMVNITKFQIVFSSYLAQFFELDLHIWYSGSYRNMFLEKWKVFVKKYFFVSRVDLGSKFSHLLQSGPRGPVPFFTKFEWSLWQNRPISASFRSWASLRMFKTSEGN